MHHRISAYLAEFSGTFLMIFIGLSAIAFFLGSNLMLTYMPAESPRLFLTALVFAAGVSLVIYSPIGRISGAHLNPVVSWSFWLLGKIKTSDALAYIIAQILGAWLGAYLVVQLWGTAARNVSGGMTLPGPGVTLLTAFICEVVIGFVLIVTLLVLIRLTALEKYIGLLIGLLVVILVYVTAPISGTSLNPARSLGPAIVMQIQTAQWIYLVAPILGGTLAVWFCHRVLRLRHPACAKLRAHAWDPRCVFACDRK